MSEQIAKTLVETCLRIGPQDVVTIQTLPAMIPLATQVALACYKQGADVLTILDTDDVYFGFMKTLDTEQLRTPSKHCLGLGGYTTANIFMGGVEDPSRFKEISGEKIAAWQESEKPHGDLMLKRKVKVGTLALSFINKKRAETYGLNLTQWKQAVEKASSEDYAKMAKFGRKVGTYLKNGHKVEITAPNGTDLTLKLAGRQPHLEDGIIDEEDLRNGTNAVTIPAGDIAVSVAEDSAEGKFVSNLSIPQAGRLVEGLTWRFKKGKAVEFKAAKNGQTLKQLYDGAGGEKDRIGEILLGLNSKADIDQLFNLKQIALGAITIGVGDNTFLGGKNNSPFQFLATLNKGTLKIDGKAIIKNGKFTI